MNTMNAMIAYWSFHWVRFTSGNNDKKTKKTTTKKTQVNSYRPATFRSLCFYKLPTPCSFGTFPSGRHVERP